MAVLGDAVVEPDETFTVKLSSPVNATMGTPTAATGTITNDDVVVPTVSIGPAAVVEGNAGTTNAVFPVTLSAATTVPVTVGYATGDGTATAGSDYTAVDGELTWRRGETSGTMVVAVLGDAVVEPDRDVHGDAEHPDECDAGDAARALGTIENDDVVLPTVSIGPATVVEGNAGTTNAVFPVTLSAATTVPVTVSYATANGTATAGSDYTAASGT